MDINVAVLTISDRSFRGERVDASGPALENLVRELGWKVSATGIVPDDLALIKDQLTAWSDSGQIDLILTTGGTGFAPTDVTPEATLAVAHKIAPGFGEYMRLKSMEKTPFGILSRATSVIRNRTLIINFPGSPKAAVENFNFISSTLPHALNLIKENPEAEQEHKPSP